MAAMTAIAWSLVALMAASLGVLATALFRLDGKIDGGFARVDARIDGLGASLNARIDAQTAMLTAEPGPEDDSARPRRPCHPRMDSGPFD